ncbi:MAG: type II CAAX endopeptidase family protein [Pseudomonadota bacterium]
MSRARAALDMPLPKVLTLIAVQAIVFAALGWGLWSLTDRSEASFVTFAWWEVGAGFALATALIALSAALALAFPKFAEWLVRSQARQYPFLKNRISLSAIVIISICAGVGEEALFRGGFQTLFGDYTPLPLALALSSALFAAIHFAKPINSALIFVIGCLFGGIYWANGSLLTVIIGHAVYDVYAIWALQEALHRFGIFDEHEEVEPENEPGEPLQAGAARESLPGRDNAPGEDQ